MKPGRIVALACALLVFLGVDVQSELTFRARKASAAKHQKLRSAERFVDLSAVVRVVERDGDTMVNGRPKLRVLREHVRGGLFDTLTKKWAGPALNPIVLTCSVHQEAAILHGEDQPKGVWLQGGKGSGKTTSGCYWLTLQVIKNAERPIQGAGVTSPVGRRMEAVRKILVGSKSKDGGRTGGKWPASWFSWREGDQVAVMATGLSIDFISAHVSNEAEGSPIQGQNWAFALSDEIQDYYTADIEIAARGRAAWNSRFERCSTATPKNDSGYRTFRNQIEANPDWRVFKMRGPDSPFVGAEHWASMARATTADGYRREALGEDTLSENRLYLSWEREANIMPVPQVPKWADVTAHELARFAPHGKRLEMLIGADPGQSVNVSVFLKAYQPPAPPPTSRNPRPRLPDPVWFVVDEVTTPKSTNEAHVRAVLTRLQREWKLNQGGAEALVRMDPSARGENDKDHPAPEVRKTYNALGLYTRSASYKPGSVDEAIIPRGARIDMVNVLLRNSLGERRLFVACNQAKTPTAPRLVEAFERLEDETERLFKGTGNDFTHWPCALGYALWAIEKPRIDSLRGAA